MTNFISKAPSSRILKAQLISLTGNAASTPSTNFTAETFQVRVASTLTGWLAIGDGAQTAAVGTQALINAGAPGEVFTVTAGQQAAFLSTSTSTGYCSLVELQ